VKGLSYQNQNFFFTYGQIFKIGKINVQLKKNFFNCKNTNSKNTIKSFKYFF